MVGLGPTIHDFTAMQQRQVVDDRHKAGHDGIVDMLIVIASEAIQ